MDNPIDYSIAEYPAAPTDEDANSDNRVDEPGGSGGAGSGDDSGSSTGDGDGDSVSNGSSTGSGSGSCSSSGTGDVEWIRQMGTSFTDEAHGIATEPVLMTMISSWSSAIVVESSSVQSNSDLLLVIWGEASPRTAVVMSM